MNIIELSPEVVVKSVELTKKEIEFLNTILSFYTENEFSDFGGEYLESLLEARNFAEELYEAI